MTVFPEEPGKPLAVLRGKLSLATSCSQRSRSEAAERDMWTETSTPSSVNSVHGGSGQWSQDWTHLERRRP